NVKDFAADGFDGRGEDLYDGFGNVPDMDKGTPLAAVVNRDDAILNGLGGEEIHDEIEPRPRGKTEDSGETKNSGVEIAGSCFEQDLLRLELRFGVERDGNGLRFFVHKAFRRAVDTATGGEDETLDSGAAGNFENHSSGGVIDLVRVFVIGGAGGVTQKGGGGENNFCARSRCDRHGGN